MALADHSIWPTLINQPFDGVMNRSRACNHQEEATGISMRIASTRRRQMPKRAGTKKDTCIA